MRKTSLPLVGLLLLTLFSTSCVEDLDDNLNPASDTEINDFIYKAMNTWYLYKPEVPVLANDRFDRQAQLDDYLDNFESPEAFFYDALVWEPDDFSFITNDYRELENQFAGISENNGMSFNITRTEAGGNQIVGFVRYVLPNTSAAANGVQRGMLFNSINGVELLLVNGGLNPEAAAQFSQTTYTIGLATLDEDNNPVATGQTITLTKEQYTANPVFIAKTLDVGGTKVGYLMYNSFIDDFAAELNAAFADFKAAGVTELVLDLRYNGGGDVATATDLGEMITGQFQGDVFAQLKYNPQIQASVTPEVAERLRYRFDGELLDTGMAINSLNLTDIAIITTSRTASASEMVINGLRPYINVIQVGTTTTGKFQASRTLYDGGAPDFLRTNANPNHFYAIQPLILTVANVEGTTGFLDGLAPDVPAGEDIANLGKLGDPEEPLLKEALNALVKGKTSPVKKRKPLEIIGDSEMSEMLYQQMYILPKDLR